MNAKALLVPMEHVTPSQNVPAMEGLLADLVPKGLEFVVCST